MCSGGCPGPHASAPVPIVAAGELAEWPPALTMCLCACCHGGGCHCLEYGPNQRCDCGPCVTFMSQQAPQQDHGNQARPDESQRCCQDARNACDGQQVVPQLVVPAHGLLQHGVTKDGHGEIAQNPPIYGHDGQGSGAA